MDKMQLIQKAMDAMQRSYSPYSGFWVGAALLCADGTVYTGCNIENASFTPTICAERTAIFKAVSEGKRDFVAIAIVGGKGGKLNGFAAPCGVCRQVMSEFCNLETFQVHLFDGKESKTYTLAELLPLAFTSIE